MQTAVIAGQNVGKNVGKTNRGNKELAFLASTINWGRTIRRRRLQMQLALNNRSKTMFKFGLPSIIAYSPKNITVPRSVRPCGHFLSKA